MMFRKALFKPRRAAWVMVAGAITVICAMADARPAFLGPANPGAENGFDEWYYGVIGGGSVSVESDDPASGRNYFKIGITNAESYPTNHADLRSRLFPLGSDGKTRGPITFSFSYKLPGEVKHKDVIDVNLRFFDELGRFLGQKIYHVGSTTHDSAMTQYKTKTVTKIFAPPKAVQADVWVVANTFTHWTSGYAQFDDFSVTVPAPPPLDRIPAVLAAVTGQGGPNLIANGSFEMGSEAPASGVALSLYPGSPAITGWTTENAEITWVHSPEKLEGPRFWTASDGDFFLDLTGSHDSAPYGSISQTISTVIGQSYNVSFNLGSDKMPNTTYAATPTAPGITVRLNGVPAYTAFVPASHLRLSNTWETEHFSFTAVSKTTALSFEGVVKDNERNGYIGLDKVVVTAGAGGIRGTVILCLLLLFGAFYMRRWRKRRVAAQVSILTF